jgi:hypothetical protein
MGLADFPRSALGAKRKLGAHLKDLDMRTVITLAVVVVIILTLVGIALPLG